MEYKWIKERALDALKYKWGTAILASLIASIFGANGSSGSSSANFDFEESDFEALEGTEFNEVITQVSAFLDEHFIEVLAFVGTLALIGFITSIAMFCLGSIVTVGYHKFNLDLVDRKSVSIGTLFSYFKNWKSAILTNLLKTVYIFLWSLLCIIPGIIAEYKYAMTPYILAENPDMDPQEALDKSTELMNGHKWHLFCLELSFVGWSILCVFTCGIGFLWLTPYVNASRAEFYRQISNTGYTFGYAHETFSEQT